MMRRGPFSASFVSMFLSLFLIFEKLFVRAECTTCLASCLRIERTVPSLSYMPLEFRARSSAADFVVDIFLLSPLSPHFMQCIPYLGLFARMWVREVI